MTNLRQTALVLAFIGLPAFSALAQQPTQPDEMATLRTDLQHVFEDVNKLLAEAKQQLVARDKEIADLKAKAAPKPLSPPAAAPKDNPHK